MITFHVENNESFASIRFDKDGYVRNWIEETNKDYCIRHGLFNGNEWFTLSFLSVCQQIWQNYCDKLANGIHSKEKPIDAAVGHIYAKLRDKSWHPTVIAVNINAKIYIIGKYKQCWQAKNDKIQIFAFC